jgi:hypothetical protein
MKSLITGLFILVITQFSYGQKEFIGIAKYKMAVVGSADEDSMEIVFDKSRILVKLYATSRDNPKLAEEMFILNDFKTNKQYIINKANKTYKVDSLLNITGYNFINTQKIKLVNGDICLHYKADEDQIDESKMKGADCLVSKKYINKNITNYWFMGIQPVIIDEKIVMDFIVTERDDSKPRIYITNLITRQNVDFYFDLSSYREKN